MRSPDGPACATCTWTLIPYLLAGARSSLSLCWKVIVAAEVIAQPARSLGAGMQAAKAMLETTELFAWTAATVLLAGLTETALFALRKRGFHGPRR
jgi:NitT/TauT family transport system permease protein